MARSADAAVTVLESVRYLYEVGAAPDVSSQELVDQLEAIGIVGFSPGRAPYFAMLGTVLRLLMRHATTDPETIFSVTAEDLEQLGRDIDDETFNRIVRGFDDSR